MYLKNLLWILKYINTFKDTFSLLHVFCSDRFAPEPLQWLLLNNQAEQARAIWRQIAEFNHVELSVEDVRELEAFQSKEITINYSMLDCFRTPGMRKKTLLACFAWYNTTMTSFSNNKKNHKDAK